MIRTQHIESPPNLPFVLAAEVHQLVRDRASAIASDFDGTLSDLVDPRTPAGPAQHYVGGGGTCTTSR